jgi:dynein intermediate chain, cytosolic
VGATTLVGAEAPGTPGTPSRHGPVYTTSIATQTLQTTEVETSHEIAPPPKPEYVTYSVAVQTSEPWPPAQGGAEDGEFSDLEDEEGTARSQKRLSRRQKEHDEELRENIRREVEEELKSIKDPATQDATVNGNQPRFPTRPLTTEELNAVTSSDDFLEFIDRSSKVIERALEEEYDVLADYALDGVEGESDDEDEGYASSRGRKGRRLKEVAQFFDERWSKKRMVSDLNFSPKVGPSHRIGLNLLTSPVS